MTDAKKAARMAAGDEVVFNDDLAIKLDTTKYHSVDVAPGTVGTVVRVGEGAAREMVVVDLGDAGTVIVSVRAVDPAAVPA